jgi:hypothetical protein
MSLDIAAPEAPSRDQFANEFIAALKSAAPTKSVSYDAEKSCVIIDSEGVSPVVHSIRNAYLEYVHSSELERTEAVRRCVRALLQSLRSLPADFEDAAHDLLPIVRARVGNELGFLHTLLEPSKIPEIDYMAIAEHLAGSIAYDLPDGIVHVDSEQLERWGVPIEAAWQRAMENLAQREHRFAGLRPTPGVYALSGDDGYQSSRLLFPSLFGQLAFNGRPVAMVPRACSLLVTGDNDEDGLRIMLERAEQELRRSTPIGGFAYRLSHEGILHPWLPAPTHKLYKQFKKLADATMGLIYTHQQQLLTQLQEKYKPADDRLFVASVFKFREESPWGAVTSCSWAKHVPSLLPKTDTISLMRDLEEPPVLVPWNVVQKTVGELMVPQGIYPERYRVDSFPSGSQFAAILGAAKRERRRRHPK